MPLTASEWRRSLAYSLAVEYPAEIVLLVGSAAISMADAWSDLDFLMYWQQLPSIKQRRKFAASNNARGIQLVDSSDDNDLGLQSLSDIYRVGENALKIDITHKTITSLEKLIEDVTVNHENHRLKLAMMNGISYSYVLAGESQFALYREQIGQLPQALIDVLLPDYLHNVAQDLIAMIVRRDDVLYARQLITQLCENVLFALCTLNHIYPPDRAKHLSWLVSQLEIKPNNLHQRITDICTLTPVQALPIVRDLLLDTLDLAETADYNVTVARQQFASMRPANHNPIYLNKDRTTNA